MTAPPYISFNHYLRERFGERVQRVALHAGMTCPNRDGTKGRGGCIFCDNTAFNPAAGGGKSIPEQLEAGMAHARKRYGARLFLAYFQTYTNTYAPVETLRKLYETAITPDSIVGLMVSTRPDCIGGPELALLQEISQRVLVWVEMGVQTSWNNTLERINRCHSWEDSVAAVRRVRAAGIPVAAHVILGLPGETPDMMAATADRLAVLGVEGLKLHHLYAVRNTTLARWYAENRWQPMTADAYIEAAARFITRMPRRTVIMRLMGDCPDRLLVAPRWNLPKHVVRERIDARLEALRRHD